MDMEPMETVPDQEDDSFEESDSKQEEEENTKVHLIEDDSNEAANLEENSHDGISPESKAVEDGENNTAENGVVEIDSATSDKDETKDAVEEDVETEAAKVEEEVKDVEEEVEEKDEETAPPKKKNTSGDQAYDPDKATSPEKSELVSGDTEMVSEDELEVEGGGGKETLETEEVSDEELPVSITEGLQTEAVSDEELPPVTKKRKKGSSKDGPSKKGKLEKESSPPSDGDKPPSSKPIHPAVKSKVLPELEKYWKAVNDDPSDFTGWTYLLQYVDQESDIEAAEEAYDSFLALYPYCYGYWRKFADYEKRKGDKGKCEEVFLRGLKAIPLSVDLWLHYLNFCKVQYKDDEARIRSEFFKALDTCGLEFRSDRLWDSFIKWEVEGKHYHNAFRLYERLLTVPTQGYKTHFEDFEDFVRLQQPNKILGADEFLSLRSEVVQKLRSKERKDVGGPPSAAPPGDDEGEIDHPSPAHADEETTLIREKIISSRKKIYKDTVTAVLARWNFEEGIKRPYFHVKALERSQLNTWREYLDFEIVNGDEKRTVILFERCLIACALYQEFWLKFIKYLEDLPKDTCDMIRDVYRRACIHHPKKAYLFLSWATFEEAQGNIEEARKILNRIEDIVPNILHVMVRHINLERRAGNLDVASQLYEKYMAASKSKANFIALSIKYARFSWKVLNDIKKGVQVLRKALEKDSDNPRLYSQLLELTMTSDPFTEDDCVKIFNEAIGNDKMDLEYRKIFSQRKVEFLEDFGTSIKSLREANAEYSTIMKELRDWKKSPSSSTEKSKLDDLNKSSSSFKGKSESASTNSYSANSTSYSSSQPPPSNYSNVNYNTSGGYQGNPQSYPPPGPGFYSGGQPGGPDQSYQPGPYQNWGGYSQTAGYSNYNQNWTGYNYYS